MRRITVSPSPSPAPSLRHSDPYAYDYDDDEGDATEVEAALNDLDNELDDTEDALTQWSRPQPPSSYTPGPEPPTTMDRDFRILSTISERTEGPSTRPTSHTFSPAGAVMRPANPTPDALIRRLGTTSTASPHSRSSTDPGGSGIGGVPGRRAGELIAFFEDRTASSDNNISHTPSHARTTSMPGGPRSPGQIGRAHV